MPTRTLLNDLRSIGIDPLTAIVSSVADLYRLPQSTLDALKADLVIDSFRFHYERNAYYQAACDEKGVNPKDIRSYDDLIRIPLIPIAKFKSTSSHELLSKPLTSVEHEMRSTGTSGIPSISRRCRQTVDLGVASVYAMYREFLGISKGAGLYICPSTEEVPEMGMIKALNMLAGLLDTHRFMVNQERFVPEDALQQLQNWDRKFTRHIIGPPFLIHRLLQFLKQTGQTLKLDKDSKVITLGGWKRFTGQMISRREFNALCQECLGVPAQNIRDIYALVESNVMAIDDEHQVKHVSPYVHFSVRNMEDLNQEVADGEHGVLAILDPLARATPGMILTEDIVRLLPGDSPSGRSGQRMEYIMRAPASLEFGCCAVNLEKTMDKNDNAARERQCPVTA